MWVREQLRSEMWEAKEKWALHGVPQEPPLENTGTSCTSSMGTSESRAQLDEGSENGQRGTVHLFIAFDGEGCRRAGELFLVMAGAAFFVVTR